MTLIMTYTVKMAATSDGGWCGWCEYDIVQVAVHLISASTCQKYCRSSKFPASVPDFVSSFKQDDRLLQHVGSRIKSNAAELAWRFGLMR
jgi:hypothetical protein